MAAEIVKQLERLADAVERFSLGYATVHNLGVTECPQCHEKARGEYHGQIIHLSGCTALWPDPREGL
jgi:hypothetical protein